MSSRIGEPSDPFEDEGLASPDPGLAGKRITGDPQDDLPVPGETPVAVDDFGTTVAEQQEGEPLDGRLSREEPDLIETAGATPDLSDDATALSPRRLLPCVRAAGPGYDERRTPLRTNRRSRSEQPHGRPERSVRG